MPKLPKTPVYIGIDPGEDGSASLVSSGGFPLWNSTGINSCLFKKSSEHDMAQWFKLVVELYPPGMGLLKAGLERVHSMPAQGVASSFTFGWNYGLVRGMLVSFGIPFKNPTPQAWQKKLGISKRDTKNEPQPQFKKRLREFAQRRWPSVADKISLPLTDSLLIAEWCRLEDKG